ncbi:MAG: AAA family ATPase [Candidatus Woesearchaeota archaeon]
MKQQCIIIRGPLGVGKTTIAKEISVRCNAHYISFDEVLVEYNLDKEDDVFTALDFIKANTCILDDCQKVLQEGQSIVFDGCFYFLEQINHLQEHLNASFIIFDLKASLETCIKRDANREKSYGEKAAQEVFVLVSKHDVGIAINVEKPFNVVIEEIVSLLD